MSETPQPRLRFAALLAPLLLAPAALPQGGVSGQAGAPTAPFAQPVETGFLGTPMLQHAGPGADFAVAGTTTRVFNPIPGAVSQSEPFVLMVPALPPGATVIETLVVWNWLMDSPIPFVDTIKINGTSVTGNAAGSGSPDLCWGKGNGQSYLALGITSLVNFGGPNTIAMATDKTILFDPSAYGDGLTVLYVYEVAGAPQRCVDVYTGYSGTKSSPATFVAKATMNFTCTYTGGPLHFFLNALDGQIVGGLIPELAKDDFYINGMLASGVAAGTVTPGEAWQGLLGPGAINNLYDHAEGDIAAFVSSGATGLVATTEPILPEFDCIAHTLGAVSFQLPPWVNYCTAGTSANGCQASISATGNPSASAASGFSLTASGAEGAKTGIFFYGANGRQANPWGNGTSSQCVTPPVKRAGLLMGSGSINACDGTFSQDLNALWNASPPKNPGPGAVVQSQLWYRDPANTSNQTTSLSDAIEFTVAP